MILMSIKIMSDTYHIIYQLRQQFQKNMTKLDIPSGFKPTPFQRYMLFKSGSISPQKSGEMQLHHPAASVAPLLSEPARPPAKPSPFLERRSPVVRQAVSTDDPQDIVRW